MSTKRCKHDNMHSAGINICRNLQALPVQLGLHPLTKAAFNNSSY